MIANFTKEPIQSRLQGPIDDLKANILTENPDKYLKGFSWLYYMEAAEKKGEEFVLEKMWEKCANPRAYLEGILSDFEALKAAKLKRNAD
ncbi:hypothetical protein [Enterococcus sp. LJL90]